MTIVLPLLLFSPAAAGAGPSPEKGEYDRCVAAAGGIPSMLNTCLTVENGRQDTRLNRVYAALRQSLDASARLKLRDEERAWIVVRDKACPARDGGDRAALVVANRCWLDRTRMRADELERRSGAPATLSMAFEGRWSYRDDCGFGHAAQIAFDRDVASAGRWSDGTRTGGEAGRFVGRLDTGELYVRFCDDSGSSDAAQCPAYGREDDGYLIRDGANLGWYRRVGEGGPAKFEKYLELHREGSGKPDAANRPCPASG